MGEPVLCSIDPATGGKGSEKRVFRSAASSPYHSWHGAPGPLPSLV